MEVHILQEPYFQEHILKAMFLDYAYLQYGWNYKWQLANHQSFTSQMQSTACGKEETMTYLNIWFLNSS